MVTSVDRTLLVPRGEGELLGPLGVQGPGDVCRFVLEPLFDQPPPLRHSGVGDEDSTHKDKKHGGWDEIALNPFPQGDPSKPVPGEISCPFYHGSPIS